MYKLLLGLLFSSSIFCSVRIVPVEGSLEPDHVQLKILFPTQFEIEGREPVVKLSLNNFPLGVDTSFVRNEEIYNYTYGQSIHLFLDDSDPIVITDAIDPFIDKGDYRKRNYSLHLPCLNEGVHTLRALVCRSYGECLKSSSSFDVRVFYVAKGGEQIDVCDPLIVLNEPQQRTYSACQPVLLDFYLKNCRLSLDGYKVRIVIDDQETIITKWQPFYLYDLEKGEHVVEVELLDQNDQVVPGEFSYEMRKFRVY